MIDSLWSPPRRTEKSEAHQELQGRILAAMESRVIDEVNTDFYNGMRFDSDEEALEDIANETYELSLALPFSKENHREVSKILSSWEDLQWGYRKNQRSNRPFYVREISCR